LDRANQYLAGRNDQLFGRILRTDRVGLCCEHHRHDIGSHRTYGSYRTDRTDRTDRTYRTDRTDRTDRTYRTDRSNRLVVQST